MDQPLGDQMEHDPMADSNPCLRPLTEAEVVVEAEADPILVEPKTFVFSLLLNLLNLI